MKVFANNLIKDYAISRIENAFKRYSPSNIEFVNTEDEADFVIIYAYGQRRKIWWRVCRLLQQGKKYAIVQTAIRSTTNPRTQDWLQIWNNAELVWSYYDLPKLCQEDGIFHWLQGAIDESPYGNFYHAPLGVNSQVFKEIKMDGGRDMTIAYGGNRNESVDEIVEACHGTGYRLGQGLTDEQLAKVYSSCEFVSGLRKVEGFELPVIEGLLCGARPIIYDRQHYRNWFSDFALRINEEDSKKIRINQLEDIFKRGAKTVSWEEKELVKKRFNWETIIKGFWENI
jgi:hypothetical protein